MLATDWLVLVCTFDTCIQVTICDSVVDGIGVTTCMSWPKHLVSVLSIVSIVLCCMQIAQFDGSGVARVCSTVTRHHDFLSLFVGGKAGFWVEALLNRFVDTWCEKDCIIGLSCRRWYITTYRTAASILIIVIFMWNCWQFSVELNSVRIASSPLQSWMCQCAKVGDIRRLYCTCVVDRCRRMWYFERNFHL